MRDVEKWLGYNGGITLGVIKKKMIYFDSIPKPSL